MITVTPGKYLGMRRLADDAGRFKMLAVDQRPPIEKLVAEAGMSDRRRGVAAVKEALVDCLASEASAILVDPQYLFPAILPSLPRSAGVVVTLEYDHFEETPGGRKSSLIPDWSVAQIRTGGGDAVKLLAWYRPDASPEIREHQQRFVEDVGQACRRFDIPFVFELLLYPMPDESGHTTDYVEMPEKKADHVIESVETFADDRFGVDLFKLEAPVSQGSLIGDAADGDLLLGKFAELNRASGRPWVMLSAGVDADSFRRILELAYQAGASGYLAGRAIWWEACSTHFPDLTRMNEALKGEAVSYMRSINDLTDRAATPWERHVRFEPNGPELPSPGDDFRRSYRPLES